MICTNCFNDEYLTTAISKEIKITGATYFINNIECEKCPSCGDIIFTNKQSMELDRIKMELFNPDFYCKRNKCSMTKQRCAERYKETYNIYMLNKKSSWYGNTKLLDRQKCIRCEEGVKIALEFGIEVKWPEIIVKKFTKIDKATPHAGGMKRCNFCNIKYPLVKMTWSRHRSRPGEREYHNRCKTCYNRMARAKYREKNPPKKLGRPKKNEE